MTNQICDNIAATTSYLMTNLFIVCLLVVNFGINDSQYACTSVNSGFMCIWCTSFSLLLNTSICLCLFLFISF